MTTLVGVYSSLRCVGTCDARCYDGKGKVCHCICNGANHGVGFAQALKNTAERNVGLRAKDLSDYAVTHDFDGPLVVVDRLRVRNIRAARRRARSQFVETPLPLFERQRA